MNTYAAFLAENLSQSALLEHAYEAATAEGTDTPVGFAVIADIRYPIEADFVRANGGIVLRQEIDIDHVADETDFKYSRANLLSPIESALDNYPHFVVTIPHSQELRTPAFIADMLEEWGLPTRAETYW